eukprot:6293058-Prorocentrum_lima.AAC.1
MALGMLCFVILKARNRPLNTLVCSTRREPGSFLNQHVDIYSCITAFFVLPIAHCTFQAALVRASTRANNHFHAKPVQKAVFY